MPSLQRAQVMSIIYLLDLSGTLQFFNVSRVYNSQDLYYVVEFEESADLFKYSERSLGIFIC